MRNIYYIFAVTLFSCFLNAQQIEIDFENQRIDNWYSPNIQHWQISDSLPVSENYSLKHNFDSKESADDWIVFFHDPLVAGATEQTWEFTVRYNFKSSANNYWAVVLGEDCILPFEKMENALVIGVNHEGSDDIIKIWQIANGDFQELINTGINWEESLLVQKPAKFIIRHKEGQLFLETSIHGSELELVGQAPVQQIESFNSFLLYYKYSSSYDRGLAIDDIKINGNFMRDTDAPNLLSVQVIGNDKLELIFDEPVVLSSPDKFCVETIGCAKSLDAISNSLVLSFENEFFPGSDYLLELPLMEDVAGNRIQELTHKFYYPSAYDILINEIMSDPNPEVLLPDAEFVELFNRTEEPIILSGWILSINGKSSALPECIISPQGYLLLTDKELAQNFEGVVNSIGVESFPAIRNSDAELILQNCMGSLIHAVNYSIDWHEAEKRDGGWSVELVNPNQPCNEYLNWTSSIDYRGGTPGEENSVYSEDKSPNHPELWRVSVIGSNTIRLYFSSGMDSLHSNSAEFFLLKPNLAYPLAVLPSWPIANSIDLQFEHNFLSDQEYGISLSNDPADCNGRTLEQKDVLFMLPKPALEHEILINEIMFDPHEGFSEYIEIYNRSEKAIELHNWKLQIEGKEAKCITQEYFTLLPGSYAIISSSLSGIDSPEIFSEAENIIRMADFPVLVNSGSIISMMDSSDLIMDKAKYHPDWHHELISNSEGVALERVSFNALGMNTENWESAGSQVNYQTPGASNSQLGENTSLAGLAIEPKTITPNGDGWNDVLQISYTMPETACMGKVLIFDLEGRLIATLANGSLLGISGKLEYDGKDNGGRLLHEGYYILYFEAYNETGFHFARKKSFVVAYAK